MSVSLCCGSCVSVALLKVYSALSAGRGKKWFIPSTPNEIIKFCCTFIKSSLSHSQNRTEHIRPVVIWWNYNQKRLWDQSCDCRAAADVIWNANRVMTCLLFSHEAPPLNPSLPVMSWDSIQQQPLWVFVSEVEWPLNLAEEGKATACVCVCVCVCVNVCVWTCKDGAVCSSLPDDTLQETSIMLC